MNEGGQSARTWRSYFGRCISALLASGQECRSTQARYGVPEGAPAISHENPRNDDAVRSMAGSTVEKDWTLSLKTARFPLKRAKVSTPLGGQATIPVRVPVAADEFGPSTTAPTINGGPFGGTGTKFVTSCCMHKGNTFPSPP